MANIAQNQQNGQQERRVYRPTGQPNELNGREPGDFVFVEDRAYRVSQSDQLWRLDAEQAELALQYAVAKGWV